MQRRLDPLAAFGHRLVGKSDDVHADLPGSDHHLHVDRNSLNPLKRNRAYPRDHARSLLLSCQDISNKHRMANKHKSRNITRTNTMLPTSLHGGRGNRKGQGHPAVLLHDQDDKSVAISVYKQDGRGHHLPKTEQLHLARSRACRTSLEANRAMAFPRWGFSTPSSNADQQRQAGTNPARIASGGCGLVAAGCEKGTFWQPRSCFPSGPEGAARFLATLSQRFASTASQNSAAMSAPPNFFTSRTPVGDVTLISVM